MSKSPKTVFSSKIGRGIALGVAIGAGFGAAIGNMAQWIGLGAAAGVIIGIIWSNKSDVPTR